jgi:hypothetical protein
MVVWQTNIFIRDRSNDVIQSGKAVELRPAAWYLAAPMLL